MMAIVRESYPEPKYIKDIESDYQVQRSVTWLDYSSDKKYLSTIRFKELLVRHMATNESDKFTDPGASHLRRGANAIQGLIRTSKRKRNRVDCVPIVRNISPPLKIYGPQDYKDKHPDNEDNIVDPLQIVLTDTSEYEPGVDEYGMPVYWSKITDSKSCHRRFLH